MSDKFGQLLSTPGIRYAVGIVGNPEAGEYALIEDVFIAPEPIAKLGRARGWRFLGVIAVVNGRTRTAFSEPLGESAIAAIAEAFLSPVNAALRPIPVN